MTELTHLPEPSESPTGLLTRPVLRLMSLDWEKIAYAVIFIVALITRLWGLGDRVMSHDESLHTQFSFQFYNGDGFQHTPLMHGPFLFHVTALTYWLLGANDFTARLPVALLGVLLVLMPYFLRHWLGRIGALTTSFLFLISPFITYYSRYIRHDIYVITWAMIVFIATWYYLRHARDKHLWWFAAGLSLMFATKEVAFIYVAIFGSFLIIRLASKILPAPWLRSEFHKLVPALIVLLVALILLMVGFGGLRLTEQNAATAVGVSGTTEGQGFAADPNAPTVATATQAATTAITILRWLQVVGMLGLGLGLLLAVIAYRPHLEKFPEFDLIILYTTLVLPLISPLLTKLAGYNPQDYTFNRCVLPGEETMSAFQIVSGKLFNAVCWSSLATSGILRSGFFLVITLVVAILIGLWWNRRRWLIAALIFHSIFLILYTSVFTNPNGWGSGMIGSLGYWLEQQEVARGNQPSFYYFFIVPFYEFLPVIFALLAVRHWTRRHALNKIAGYWLTLVLLCMFLFSFGNWVYGRILISGGDAPATSKIVGLILAGILFLVGTLYWFLRRRQELMAQYGLKRSWRGLLPLDQLVGFVPNLIWWMLLTWLAYSIAGEKMPWLTTHFVIPMALLTGWYLNDRIREFGLRRLLSRQNLIFLGLASIFIVALFLAMQPLLLGQIRLGDQAASNLSGIGRFLGSVLVAGGLFYLLWRVGQQLAWPQKQLNWVLSIFLLLSVLTMRFTYMSSFPNADYAREFMVYAHAAPAVKSVVMPQIDELSLRLYGDKSMVVAWDDDSTWPMQWYLKEYPNRRYFGKSPDRSITDAPVIVVGSNNWNTVEPLLGDDYEVRTYTFLWWPIEDYRRLSWNALFGLADYQETPEAPYPSPRGLASADVRRAIWDIFFYRDYTQYGDVFDKPAQVTTGQWELRHDLRLYIRKDVLANLWDYGVGAAAIEPPVDPYAGGELTLLPSLVIGAAGSAEGQLLAPRNVAVGPDGNVYVVDSNNHRVQVFDADGAFLRAWGAFGSEPGLFNEPWGITVDDEFVYVADTWNHRLQKFTLTGELVKVIGQSGNVVELGADSGGYFFGPRAIVLLPDNQLAVTDTGNHRLQIFDRDGNFVQQVGSQGTLPGQFNEPVGLAVSGDGLLYLADTWNGRVQRFDASFFPSLEWPVDAWAGNSTNNKPYVAVDSSGRVYVTDPENYRVLIFSGEGQYLGRFGQYSPDLDGFGLPNGIFIDAQDYVYIADAGNGRILRFDPLPPLAPPAPPAENDGN